MQTVSASEAKQSFASVLDACVLEPVLIRKQKRDMAVIMSVSEYERLTRLNVLEFQRFCDTVGASATAAGMTEDKLAELLGHRQIRVACGT